MPSPLGAGAELLLVISTSEMVLSFSSLLKEFRLKSESGKERKLALVLGSQFSVLSGSYDCCQFLFRDQAEIAPLKPPDSTPLLSVSGFIYNLSSHP